MTPWSETSWKTLQNVLRTVSLEAWEVTLELSFKG